MTIRSMLVRRTHGVNIIAIIPIAGELAYKRAHGRMGAELHGSRPFCCEKMTWIGILDIDARQRQIEWTFI